MKKTIDFSDFTVYNITNINKKYGFRIALIYPDGSRKITQRSGFTTKREAENERNKIIVELSNGFFLNNEKIILKDFLNKWLEKEIKQNKAANTYITFKNIITKYINPSIGNIDLKLLNRSHIQRLYRYSAKEFKSIVEMTKSVINIALNYAVKNNYIELNIAENVDIPKTKIQKQNSDATVVRKVLTEKEIKRLIINSKDTPIYLYILFASLMGLRISEIRGLKHSDVNYINQTLNIQRQLGRNENNRDNIKPGKITKQEIPLKTYSSYREIPIPDIIFEEIIKSRKIYERNRRRRINDKTTPFYDGEFICCSTYGNPRSNTFHYKHFKKLLIKNNLPDIRFHDLRKSYTTMLIKNNFNPKAVSNLLGHSRDLITIDVYTSKEVLIEEVIEDINHIVDEYVSKDTGDFNTKGDKILISDIQSKLESRYR